MSEINPSFSSSHVAEIQAAFAAVDLMEAESAALVKPYIGQQLPLDVLRAWSAAIVRVDEARERAEQMVSIPDLLAAIQSAQERAELAELERDEAQRRSDRSYQMLAPIFHALGLFDGARPTSPVEAIEREVLVAIEALKTNNAGKVLRFAQHALELWKDALSSQGRMYERLTAAEASRADAERARDEFQAMAESYQAAFHGRGIITGTSVPWTEPHDEASGQKR